MDDRGKPKSGFPPSSTALGNRCCDSHIPTAPTKQRGEENQNQVSHSPLPHGSPSQNKTKTNTKKGGLEPSLSFRLQAHSSMRKCWAIGRIGRHLLTARSGRGSIC